MENVFFEPWIGDNYWSDGWYGNKILVIGNSHYCKDRNKCSDCGVDGYCFDDDGCSDFTTDVINTYLNSDSDRKRSGWMRTYKNFEKALCGYNTDDDDSYNIWHSIAFYNYLQTAVRNWKDSGNDDDYDASENAFWEVLEELRPDCIIMWGNRVWSKAPGYNGVDVYELDDGTEIPALKIHHPSMGFSWKQENESISSFLESVN